MESVMKEFRALSKSVKPQVYCLPLLGPYCHEIQLTLKKTPSGGLSATSEVAFSCEIQVVFTCQMGIITDPFFRDCWEINELT